MKERELSLLEKNSKHPDATADLLVKQQKQYLDNMSQQSKELHALMAQQHDNFMQALTQQQQQITALVESQQKFEIVLMALGMQQRP